MPDKTADSRPASSVRAGDAAPSVVRAGADDQACPLDGGLKSLRVGSDRRCIATRQVVPAAALIRFVVGPDDSVVVDLAANLPGRGAWVTGTAAMLERAIKQQAFAAAFKRRVSVGLDLPRQVEHALRERARMSLGLCNKAGLLTFGQMKVEKAIEARRCYALIAAADGAADGIERLARKHRAVAGANGMAAIYIMTLGSDDLGLAVGRSNVIHAALSSGGAATAFVQNCMRLETYCGVALQLSAPKLDVDGQTTHGSQPELQVLAPPAAADKSTP